MVYCIVGLCIKHYECWLMIGKVIALIKGATFLWFTVRITGALHEYRIHVSDNVG